MAVYKVCVQVSMVVVVTGVLATAVFYEHVHHRQWRVVSAHNIKPVTKSARLVASTEKKNIAGIRENLDPSTADADSEKRMRLRARRIMENCKQIPQSVLQQADNQLDKNSVYFQTNNRTSFSMKLIFKNGYTSWKHLFLNAMIQKLSLPKNSRIINEVKIPGMSATNLRNKTQLLASKERIVFVRNPYDRFVSAYKNKVLGNDYGGKHLHKHCPRVPRFSKGRATFKQFAECVVHLAAGHGFVSQLLAQRFDQHWKPQFYMSMPCQTNYTLVGEFADYRQDMNTVLRLTDLQRYTDAMEINSSNRSPGESLAYWYKQIEKQTLTKLQELYKYDFMVFGYDPTPPV